MTTIIGGDGQGSPACPRCTDEPIAIPSQESPSLPQKELNQGIIGLESQDPTNRKSRSSEFRLESQDTVNRKSRSDGRLKSWVRSLIRNVQIIDF